MNYSVHCTDCGSEIEVVERNINPNDGLREVAGIGSEMVDEGVSLDHAGRVVDNITDEYELGA